MADPIRVSGAVSGTDKTLSLETGKLAPQSQGAVVATIGGTTVLTTANAAHDVRPGMDFFPLTVDVEERMYAAGRIPGSFFRREGRPSEDAILTCRLIDRPLRPTFAKGLRNEVQVVITVLSLDPQHLYDVLAINGASASTQLSGLPFSGPVGGTRVALIADHASGIADWEPERLLLTTRRPAGERRPSWPIPSASAGPSPRLSARSRSRRAVWPHRARAPSLRPSAARPC